VVGFGAQEMRYASIDIGTNTILMLIGEVTGGGGEDSLKITPIKDFYSVPRLGKNVSVTGRLDENSIELAFNVLRNYKAIAGEHKVDRIIASATSAVRDAANRDGFVRRVRSELGIEVEVISGELEAEMDFIGAVSGAPDPSQQTLVIDIGGGSTELSYGKGFEPSLSRSIDIGAVRVTERFLHHNPPILTELKKAAEFITAALNQFPFTKINPRVIFGVAGTPTTLALIAQRRHEFDASAVTNYPMTTRTLRKVFDEIKSKPSGEILELTKAAEGRADVLVAGALILLKVLEVANAAEFLTTDRGLRYGYLFCKHKGLLEK